MFSPLRLVFEHLVHRGDLVVVDPHGKTQHFGDGTGVRVGVRIVDTATEKAICFDAPLALGEAYMRGTFILEHGRIYDFLRLVLGSSQIAQPVPAWSRAFDGLRRLTRRLQQINSAGRSKRNVAHHYDIDGSIYDLFLDKDRQYSCAYFEPGNDDLDRAQLAKKRHLASKLMLKDGQKVLDIGSGWGGLGLYLADTAQVDVTGVTLSEEQLSVSRERITQQGLADRVRFKLQDYRHVSGRFDRIVSVGMFEHVGVNHYDQFFRTVRDLLCDDGVAVIHSIGRFDRPAFTNPFIRKYIFPGGYIPSLSEVLPAIERAGLFVSDVEILRLHYAETLRLWRERFLNGWDQSVGLLGEEFCRMWEFYLAGSEAAFRYQSMMVFQIQLTKQLATLPLTRDYMFEEERRLKACETELYAPRLAGE